MPGELGAVNSPRWPPGIVSLSNDLLTAVTVCGALSWFSTVIVVPGGDYQRGRSEHEVLDHNGAGQGRGDPGNIVPDGSAPRGTAIAHDQPEHGDQRCERDHRRARVDVIKLRREPKEGVTLRLVFR